jgi:hypothetical protein
MAAICMNCGNALGMGRRLRGAALCQGCERDQQAAREAATVELKTAIREAIASDEPAAVASRLPAIAQRSGLSPAQLSHETERAIRESVEQALEDEHLTEAEERRIDAAVSALGVPEARVAAVLGDLASRFIIARVNAGRMPEVDDSVVMLKKGEIAHYQVAAALMKEVTHRETRGGYSGVSIPIAKGVRFKTGSYRGRSVVVGTSLQVADTGTITVTSQRVVYKGLRKTVETPYSKLLGVNVFNDGIQFHASNRQSAPLFKLNDGYVVAAVVNAAWQRL